MERKINNRTILNLETKEDVDRELMKGLKSLQTEKQLTSDQVMERLIKELDLKK